MGFPRSVSPAAVGGEERPHRVCTPAHRVRRAPRSPSEASAAGSLRGWTRRGRHHCAMSDFTLMNSAHRCATMRTVGAAAALESRGSAGRVAPSDVAVAADFGKTLERKTSTLNVRVRYRTPRARRSRFQRVDAGAGPTGIRTRRVKVLHQSSERYSSTAISASSPPGRAATFQVRVRWGKSRQASPGAFATHPVPMPGPLRCESRHMTSRASFSPAAKRFRVLIQRSSR